MTIGSRLTLTFAVTIALLVAAALFGIYQLNRALAVYEVDVQAHNAMERQASDMLVDFKTQVQEWKNTLLRGQDSKQLDRYWSSFVAHEIKVSERGRQLMAVMPAGEGRHLVERFLQAHGTMGEGYRKGFEAFQAAQFDPKAGDAAVTGMDRAPARLLDEAIVAISKESQAISERAGVTGKQSTVISLVLMALVCASSVVVCFFVCRSVIRPIRQAVDVAQEVAAGNLSAAIEFRGRDEMAQLLQALQVMQQRLADVVARVREGSESVAVASAEIAQGNQELSARTERQASSLEETAASMEELGSTVQQTADHARQASQLAQNASAVAEQGGQVVSRVVDTMKGINDSARRIHDIIGVIDGIAFQTNILALNAAVEAARAGEQGRGFAVVAAEVRALAQRSAGAAREIKQLISDSVSRVEHGSSLVDQAGTTMIEVVEAIRTVTRIIGEISSASSEQSTGVAQVGEAVVHMDQTTQQNAALVEQMAAAAASLKAQSRELVQTVSVFRLQQRPQLALGQA